MNKQMFIAAGSIALLALAGCGSGGGSASAPTAAAAPVVNALPGGIFKGTLNNSTSGTTDQMVGLIDENGRAVFLDTTNPTIYRFTVTPSGNSFSTTFKGYAGTGIVFPNGLKTTGGTISGTIASRSSITGTGTAAGGTGSSFSVAYQKTDYETPAPFSLSNGTYKFQIVTNTTVTVTFTLDMAGNITGSDTSGCNFTGTATIPNATFNAYNLSINGACGGTAFTATGLAVFTPASGGNPATITFEYDDGNSRAVAGVATKQ